MKIIEPEVKMIKQDEGLDGIYKAIAEAAYICYQTHPDKAKLTPKEFVEKVLIPNKHLRPLEFGTVYLELPYWENFETTKIIGFFRYNNWTKVHFVGDPDNPRWAITTNARVIVENKFEYVVEQYLCEPTKNHSKRYTADFTCSRGASDDFRTHVMLSSVAESTRFCNYSKDKFENELTFISPYWNSIIEGDMIYKQRMFIFDQFKQQEIAYLQGAKLGMIPQQLKRIFPLGAKTQLRLCGFKDAWENFFEKRCDEHADPECRILANRLKDIIYE